METETENRSNRSIQEWVESMAYGGGCYTVTLLHGATQGILVNRI